MASLVKSHQSLVPGEIQNQEKRLLLTVQPGAFSAHCIFCYAFLLWWPRSALVAAGCAHLQPSIILSLWYQAPESTGELDGMVPELHLFSGTGPLRKVNYSMEEGYMRNGRHSGDSDGHWWGRQEEGQLLRTGTAKRTVTTDKKHGWRGLWGWWVDSSCEKILLKWRHEGKTIMKAQMLGTNSKRAIRRRRWLLWWTPTMEVNLKSCFKGRFSFGRQIKKECKVRRKKIQQDENDLSLIKGWE